MKLTSTAYSKWGYDKPKGGGDSAGSDGKPASKPVSYVFLVRCEVIELRLTLQEKALSKSLQDGILTPFLGAYAKKAKRECTAADVRRVEVDGMPVAPSTRLGSLVRPEEAPKAKTADGVDHDAFMAAIEAAKERGASEAELAAMSRRYLAASSPPGEAGSTPQVQLPAARPPTRVELFLQPSVAASSAAASSAAALVGGGSQAVGGGGGGDGPQVATKPVAAKPNVDYSKWNQLDDSDDEDYTAAIAAAENAAKSAQVVADAAAGAALEAAGGRVEDVSDAAKAPVHAKIAEVEKAKARVASLQEAADAKAKAKAKAAKEAEAAKAAATRSPAARTVKRRAWSDWDKVKLDSSDDDDVITAV